VRAGGGSAAWKYDEAGAVDSVIQVPVPFGKRDEAELLGVKRPGALDVLRRKLAIDGHGHRVRNSL
jgi:hypothetical protein